MAVVGDDRDVNVGERGSRLKGTCDVELPRGGWDPGVESLIEHARTGTDGRAVGHKAKRNVFRVGPGHSKNGEKMTIFQDLQRRSSSG